MTQGQDEGPKTSAGRSSLFLERNSYRRRRLTDAARLLPFLGAALIAVPLLWPEASAGGAAVPLSSAIFYIFACWGGLILVTLGFGFAARRFSPGDEAGADSDKWQR